jgi:hypothetical protein
MTSVIDEMNEKILATILVCVCLFLLETFGTVEPFYPYDGLPNQFYYTGWFRSF